MRLYGVPYLMKSLHHPQEASINITPTFLMGKLRSNAITLMLRCGRGKQ